MNWESLYQKIYDFLWEVFCDWYIEMAKVRIWNAQEDAAAANDALWTLRTVLTEALKLLHPFMPFYHRGDLLYAASTGRFHHDLPVASVPGSLEFPGG